MDNAWSSRDIEAALAPLRLARQVLLPLLLTEIVFHPENDNSYLLLTRLFCRLKSADSILEKMHRKSISVSAIEQLPHAMPDLLGVRIITNTESELWNVDACISTTAQIHQMSRTERMSESGEFGERGINYELALEIGQTAVPFELQLMTYFQYLWVRETFRFFHKKSRERRIKHKKTLLALSEALARAAEEAKTLNSPSRETDAPAPLEQIRQLPICSSVNLVAFGAEEMFGEHLMIKLTGDSSRDHQRIVDAKMGLYNQFPVLVESSSMGFQTFTFNEPHVRIPAQRLTCIDW